MLVTAFSPLPLLLLPLLPLLPLLHAVAASRTAPETANARAIVPVRINKTPVLAPRPRRARPVGAPIRPVTLAAVHGLDVALSHTVMRS